MPLTVELIRIPLRSQADIYQRAYYVYLTICAQKPTVAYISWVEDFGMGSSHRVVVIQRYSPSEIGAVPHPRV